MPRSKHDRITQRIAYALGLLWVSIAWQAHGDLLVVKVGGGSKNIECVILKETDSQYRVEMKMGKKPVKVGFNKSRVLRVERHSAEVNAALRAKWAGRAVPGAPGSAARVALGPPPAALGLDPFYEKYLDANGIPIVASGKVPAAALRKAQSYVNRMLAHRPDIRAALVRGRVRVAIMAPTEVTTDIPEHRDLNTAFPGTNWDTRARGVGATKARPACSGATENLLGLKGDRYRGENILIHEFAHTIHTMGLNEIDKSFQGQLDAAYRQAMAKGLWKKTYAATNAGEYWAEGVQDWFNVNRQAKPADGQHNHVNTRKELLKYDPTLAHLIANALGE